MGLSREISCSESAHLFLAQSLCHILNQLIFDLWPEKNVYLRWIISRRSDIRQIAKFHEVVCDKAWRPRKCDCSFAGSDRTPESTPRCLIQKRSNFAIFYPNRFGQFLSEIDMVHAFAKPKFYPNSGLGLFFSLKIFWPLPRYGSSPCLLASSRQQSTTAEGK
jgi:hypothetical protein